MRRATAEMGASFPEHEAFQKAVADLGARIVGGAALQNSRHGGTVTPGAKDRPVEDAVYTDGPFTDTSEVITGFYLVETDDEDTARRDRRAGADRRPHRVAQGLPGGGVVPLGSGEFEQAWPRIVRALASFTGSLDDAEEYAAEAVARAAAHERGAGTPIESYAAWCTSVAKRAWLDDARRRRVERRLAPELARPDTDACLRPVTDRTPWMPTISPARASTTASRCSSSPATRPSRPLRAWCSPCGSSAG